MTRSSQPGFPAAGETGARATGACACVCCRMDATPHLRAALDSTCPAAVYRARREDASQPAWGTTPARKDGGGTPFQNPPRALLHAKVREIPPTLIRTPHVAMARL